MIGSTAERERLRTEIERALAESIEKDKKKEELQNKEEEKREHQEIRRRRRSRVLPEPDLSEDHIVMSVQHPTLGLRRRVFPADVKMSFVYDWVGSIDDSLAHFSLFDRNSNYIPPEVTASDYSNQTLLVHEIEATEVVSNENYFSELQKLREAEREKLDHDQSLNCTVSRENIFIDMMNLFRKRTTLLKIISISFDGEDAVGDGVTTDAFTTFFEALYRLMDGNNQKVPSIRLTDEELLIIGKIINHAFLVSNIFPIEISMVSFFSVMFHRVDDEEILSTFLNFLTDSEKNLIEMFSQGVSMNTQAMYDILLEYGIFVTPTSDNI